LGSKTIVRAKIVCARHEEEVNKVLAELDEDYVINVVPVGDYDVLISYAIKRSQQKKLHGKW